MKNSNTFRLFISSTFNDFREERTVLQTKVFPIIKEYCLEKGYRFQPIDLRWGISNEAQLDQKTLELCLEEVKICKTYPHPNFLIMLGDRYGWVPLPYIIEQNEFDEILKIVDENENISLLKWYKLDKNQLPASYILKQRDGEYEDIEKWNTIENNLLLTLQNAVDKTSLTTEQKRKYFTSATEAEIEEGIIPYLKPTFHQLKLLHENPILEKEDTDYILGFLRNIEFNSKYSNKFISTDYNNAQVLKTKIKELLKPNNLFECDTIQINQSDLDQSYLEVFKNRIIEFLKVKLENQIIKATSYSELEIEKQEQEYFAEQKRLDFLGQESILVKIQDYIENDKQTPFILYGKPGSGKSSIIAKAISQVKKEKQVIYRFVGATPKSDTIQKIFESIFDELGFKTNALTKIKEALLESLPKEIKELKLDFEITNLENNLQNYYTIIEVYLRDIKKEVVIFIDAVDQLSHGENFTWLSNKLPKNLKFVISALEDESYQSDSAYFKSLSKITPNTHLVEQFDKPEELILNLLKKESRTLQTNQLKYFLNQYNNVKTPLYIYVAAQEIKHWKSDDLTEDQAPVRNCIMQGLANSQKTIIEEFIKNLTKKFHHNSEFVRKVLSYINLSKDGLSENELLKILNTDIEFVKKIAPNTWHENLVKELPLAIWSRFHTHIKPFLNKKTQDNEILLYFSHREFRKVVSFDEKEHLAFIASIDYLIQKNQKSSFDSNRWGKLLPFLVINADLNYQSNCINRIKPKLINKEWYRNFLSEVHLQGKINYENFHFDESEKYTKYYYELISNLYEKDNISWRQNYITSLATMATIQYKKNNLLEAIEYIEKNIAVTSKLYLNSSLEFSQTYSSVLHLASQLYSTINIEKAISYGEKCIQVKENYAFKPGELHEYIEETIEYLTNLQFNYRKNKDLDSSIKIGIKCLEKANILFSISKEKWTDIFIESVMNLAESYLDNKNAPAADKLISQALELCEIEYANNNLKWINKLYKIYHLKSLYYSLINDIDYSIEYCNKAMNLQQILIDNKCDFDNVGKDFTKTIFLLIEKYNEKRAYDKIIDLSNVSIKYLDLCYENDKETLNRISTTLIYVVANSYKEKGDLKIQLVNANF